MLTYHILRYLQDNGFGTIDNGLYWEKLPLDVYGIAIYSRPGTANASGNKRRMKQFDLYARGKSDLGGMQTLERVQDFLLKNYDNLCDLPVIPGFSERKYTKATITSTDEIENLGLDENDRLIFRLGCTIYYQKDLGE